MSAFVTSGLQGLGIRLVVAEMNWLFLGKEFRPEVAAGSGSKWNTNYLYVRWSEHSQRKRVPRNG